MGRDKKLKQDNKQDKSKSLYYKDILHLNPDDWTPEEREKDLKYWEEESAKLTDWPPM